MMTIERESKLILAARDGAGIASAIMQGLKFTTSTGNMRGLIVPQGANLAHFGLGFGLGHLPERVKAQLRHPNNRPLIDYVVYSYDTPIAWHVPKLDYKRWNEHKGGLETAWHGDFWTFPDIRYSVTTNRHQGIVRRALLMAPRVQDVPDSWKA